MSGRKTTSYGFDRSQQQRASALLELQTQQRDLKCLQESVKRRQQALQAVLHKPEQSTLESSSEWIRDSQATVSPGFSLNSATSDMLHASRICREFNKSGKKILEDIEHQLNSIRGLTTRWKTLVSKFAASREEMYRWLPTDDVEGVNSQLDRIRVLVGICKLEDADASLSSVAKQLANLSQSAEFLKQEAIRDSKLRTIEACRAKVIEGCRFINTLVTDSSDGVQDFFNAPIEDFRAWHKLAREDLSECAPDESDDLDSILNHVSELQRSMETYREILEEKLLQEAPIISADCERQLSELRSGFDSSRPLLEKWLPELQMSQHTIRLDQLAEFLNFEQFNRFYTEFSSAKSTTKNVIETARSQEQAHDRRIYVISSLMQVCDEMGFEVSQKPAFVDPEFRGSQIRVAFDTGNRGEVVFLLSLDSIEVNSCMSGTQCFEEFRQLSEQLKNGFGVETTFRGEEMSQPRRIRKGELDEPTGGHHSSGV